LSEGFFIAISIVSAKLKNFQTSRNYAASS